MHECGSATTVLTVQEISGQVNVAIHESSVIASGTALIPTSISARVKVNEMRRRELIDIRGVELLRSLSMLDTCRLFTTTCACQGQIEWDDLKHVPGHPGYASESAIFEKSPKPLVITLGLSTLLSTCSVTIKAKPLPSPIWKTEGFPLHSTTPDDSGIGTRLFQRHLHPH